MKYLFYLVFFSATLIAHSQTLTPVDVSLTLFYQGLNSPTSIQNCGDSRLFITEQNQGDIEIVDSETGQYIGTFLDVSPLISTGGERGLLSMAFHPNYTQNGFFFINYTNTSGHTVVARYKVSTTNPNVADPNSAQVIITVNQPAANHNGGCLAFGADGYLYIGMGDGGGAGDPQNRAQNPQLLLGKMLRLDVDNGLPYTIPNSNPFVGSSTYLPEIWSIGLRNPWKFSFDRQTGDMWIADVGQNLWEEINMEPAGISGGLNYGWKCYEGNHSFSLTGCLDSSSYTFPVMDFSHGQGFLSITGGYVYRGNRYPALQGMYFWSDYGLGDIMSLARSASGSWVFTNHFPLPAGTTTFGEDMNGELYVAQIGGAIFRMDDTCGDFYPQNESAAGALHCTGGGSQYWWYKDGVEISGATTADYAPSASGEYYAISTNGTCTRQTNSVNWIVVGGIGGCTYANAENYSPNAQVDNGSCTFGTPAECPGDLNGNGFINVDDLSIFLTLYGSFCD